MQFHAVLAATLVIAAVPAFSQSPSTAATPQAQQEQSPYPGTVVEDIIARVNDQVISKSDYTRALQNLDAEGRQQGWSDQEINNQKRDLLRNLIDQQLLLSKGKELDITGEDELVKRLDDIRKQNHLDSMDALQKAAESQGVSYEDFKANIRNSIITSEVIRDQVGRHISLSPSEIDSYYDQHKAEFDHPEQVRLSEILVPTANPDDAPAVAKAQAQADDIEAKLKSGADFATLAKTDSKGQTAAEGGDLGEFKRGQLAKVLEDQTFDLQAGQFTQPIRTRQGFVILKVIQHTPGGVVPLKDVEPQVEEAVGMQKMQPALRQYLMTLRDQAYIVIKQGYVDSGASPNEQNIVYSAYTPPGPKKKKHVTRARYRQSTHKAKVVQTAAAPSNVPSLADVPQSGTAASAQPAKTTQTASTAAMKPGKKEKIRYGQAPRETLPGAPTLEENAGATSPAAGNTQTASNVPADIVTDGESRQAQARPEKTRFSAQAKKNKVKKSKVKKTDPFAPPPETKEELATRQEQSAPLGLNGDTATKKKVKKKSTGEKTRFSDDSKKKKEEQSTQPAASATDQNQPPAAPSAQPDSQSTAPPQN